MKNLLRGAFSLSAAICFIVLAPSIAAADGATREWERWEQPEWTAGAGVYCDFALRLEVIHQDIERRTLQTYPDGQIKLEQYRGPLTNYFVNDSTGEKTFHDASGKMRVEYYSDGEMKTMTMLGPVGAGFTKSDGPPRGYYVMDGYHVITVSRSDVKDLAVDVGAKQDVCAGLE